MRISPSVARFLVREPALRRRIMLSCPYYNFSKHMIEARIIVTKVLCIGGMIFIFESRSLRKANNERNVLIKPAQK